MPMKLRLHKIVCTNVCEYVDLELNLSNGCNSICLPCRRSSGNNIDLADMITMILSGRPLEPNVIEALKPENKEITNGSLELTIDLNNEKCLIRLEIDYLEKCSRYNLTVSNKKKVRSASELPGRYRIDDRLLEFITPTKMNILELFDQNSYLAEEMIGSVSSLDKIIYIGDKAQEIGAKDADRRVGQISANKNINRQNSLLNKYRLIEMRLEEYRNETHSSLVTIKSVQNRMVGNMGSLVRKMTMSRLNELNDRKRKEPMDHETFIDVIVPLKYPLFISRSIFNSIHELHHNLGDIKCPASPVPTILRNISASQFCICGNEIDDLAKDNINKVLDRSSLSDPYLVMNNVRRSLDNFKDSPLFEYLLVKNKSEISSNISVDTPQSKTTQSRILDATVLPALNKTAKTILDLEKEAENMRYDFMCLTDIEYNNDSQSNIPACRQKIREISLELENADLAEESMSKIKLFSNIVDDLYSEAMGTTVDRIIRILNTKLASIRDDDVIVEDIDPHIILNVGDLNDHQKNICGLAFVRSMLIDSGIDLPFIINNEDSEPYSTDVLNALSNQSILITTDGGR